MANLNLLINLIPLPLGPTVMTIEKQLFEDGSCIARFQNTFLKSR